MCTENFKKFIENCLKEILGNKNIKDLFKVLCNNTVAFYKETQVIFAEKFATRVAYVTGSGMEKFNPQEKIELNDRYVVFLQNFENISSYEKDILISMFKLAVLIKNPE